MLIITSDSSAKVVEIASFCKQMREVSILPECHLSIDKQADFSNASRKFKAVVTHSPHIIKSILLSNSGHIIKVNADTSLEKCYFENVDTLQIALSDDTNNIEFLTKEYAQRLNDRIVNAWVSDVLKPKALNPDCISPLIISADELPYGVGVSDLIKYLNRHDFGLRRKLPSLRDVIKKLFFNKEYTKEYIFYILESEIDSELD